MVVVTTKEEENEEIEKIRKKLGTW